MDDRQYDITVFGATGYAGKIICMTLVDRNVKYGLGLKIAFAGRSNERLKELANDLEPSFSDSNVSIIIADVFDPNSLLSMCQQTKVVINCVGPYRFYGENVIKQCIDAKTHYVDITGEPQFMEIIELKYTKLAEDNKVSIVMSCGFDSFPADITTIYLLNKLNNNKPDSIRICHDISTPTIHSTTWRTAILSVESVSELKKLRNTNNNNNNNNKDIRKHYNNPYFLYEKRIHKYCTKFIGSDHSVIRRTLKKLNIDLNINLSVYQLQKNIIHFVLFILYSMFVYVLLLTSYTRDLLSKYPSIFTFGYVKEEGASLADLKKGYTKTYAIGELGDEVTIVKFQGPEPGYILTSLTSMYSAITIIKDPNVQRGVLTPGYAFRNTDIVEKIRKEGMEWRVLYQGNKNEIPGDLD